MVRIGLLLATLLLSACSVSQPWTQVAVAGEPRALLLSQERLLPAGSLGGAPWLSDTDLEPVEPYAAAASLVELHSSGDRWYALGVRTGGAHGNPRWTVWDGPVGGPLTSRPQSFATFGGYEAGPLLGIVTVQTPAPEPVILGTWGTASGSALAWWQLDGETWRRSVATDPEAISSPDLALGAGAVTAWRDRLLVAGDSVELAGAVRQVPSLRVGTLSGDWLRIDLPVPAAVPDGGLRRATAVTCTDQRCWVAGWAGHPLVWEVEPGSWRVLATVPLRGTPPAGADPVALLSLVGGRPVMVGNTAEPRAWQRCPGGWQELPEPPPDGQQLLGLATTAHLIADRKLWQVELPTC